MRGPEGPREPNWFVAVLALLPAIPAAGQQGMMAWHAAWWGRTGDPDALGFMLALWVFWTAAWVLPCGRDGGLHRHHGPLDRACTPARSQVTADAGEGGEGGRK